MSMEDTLYNLMEEHRINQLKELGKRNRDYDQLLKTVPVDEIEKYLRRLKLENINKGVHGML